LRKLDRPVARRIVETTEARLAAHPRKLGKPLRGPVRDLYRFRIGDHRVVYQLRESELVILIVRVAHRSKVYRRLAAPR